MNIYTIRRATQGLADYINAAGLPKKVAIGHDSRHKGELFSREAARVLAANGKPGGFSGGRAELASGIGLKAE